MKYIKIDENLKPVEGTLVTLNELKKIHSNYTYTNNNLNSFLELIHYVPVYNPDYDPTLKESSTKRLDDSTIIKTEIGDFKRVFTLVDVAPEDVPKRILRKKFIIDKTIKDALKDSEYTMAKDWYLQRDEWIAYRDNLKLCAEQLQTDLDPYTLDLGKRPKFTNLYTTIEEARYSKKAEIKAAFLKELETTSRTTTSLGFDVDVSERALNNYKIGQKQGLLLLKDADNVVRDITLDDYDIIIDTVEAVSLSLYNKKWALEKQIDETEDIFEIIDMKW